MSSRSEQDASPTEQVPGTPVEVRRTGEHTFVATNGRGGEVTIGRDGVLDGFTPGELLLAAIAGCSAVTVESLVTRRIGDDAEVTFHADRTKEPDDPNTFSAVQVAGEWALSSLDEQERAKLAEAAHRAIDRACTVSRSVKRGTPISLDLPE